jgi:prevent-host-death family protein
MDKSISAANANRNFSKLLRDVRKGRSYIVTSHGEPVAKLVPTSEKEGLAERALASLMARLKTTKPARGKNARKRWTREELYQDSE